MLTNSLRIIKRYSSGTTSNVLSLEQIRARWGTMSEQERKDITKRVRDIQVGSWANMSIEDKKLAYFVTYGPEKEIPGDGKTIFFGVCGMIAASLLIFAGLRSMGKETPRTLTPEWKKATEEKLRRNKADPITGISSK